MPKILVLEDDQEQSEPIKSSLQTAGHEVDAACDVATAKAYLEAIHYDVIILDWNLPDGTGIELLSELRASGKKVPVLMLTGNATIENKETGFHSGADDYLTKPFQMRELNLRVDALLRRPPSFEGLVLKARDLELDTRSFVVRKNGAPIKLQPREFALLLFFMRNQNTVFSCEAILERVWSTDAELGIESVRKSIQRLRASIDDKEGESSYIRTSHTHGYSFNP